MGKPVRLQVYASGRVQGVNYRWFVLQRAEELGLKGWVRNLPDGRVEAEVEGDQPTVDKLLTAMRAGPRMSQVTDLDVNTLAYEGRYTDFRIR